MASFMDKFRQNLAVRRPAPQPRGLVRQRDPVVRVGQDHMFYGNGDEQQKAAMERAKKKLLKENMMRQAFDENRKAFRVVCIDEFPQ